MKSERLFSILLMLQARPLRTARQLADALEVSERTIYRDIDSLSAAGVPVYAQPGAQGGIVLSEGYRKTLTHFDEDEVRALFVTGESALADLGLDRGLDRALEKVRSTLPDAHRRAAEHARARIVIDQRRWNSDAAPRESLAILRRAVWDDRCVTMSYSDRGGKRSRRTVAPLGLVSKAGVWYVVARADGEYRTFRVDRITGIAETSEHFERPQDFDLEAHWKSSTQAMLAQWPQYVNVVIRIASGDYADFTRHWTHEVLEDCDEMRIRVSFPGRDAALYQAVAWGNSVTIESPDDLRLAVVAKAREIVKAARIRNSSRARKPVTG
ncbi:MAG TPA: YafY family protein [Candidatus Baltobacteraceae bacterium]|jgi:predicted DNA-binding transcriptional regulator YafY